MAETFVNKTVALGNTVDVSVYSPAAATTAIVIPKTLKYLIVFLLALGLLLCYLLADFKLHT